MSNITNTSSIDSSYTAPDATSLNYTATSNEAVVDVISSDFTKAFTADKDTVVPDEELTLTITLTNNTEYNINQISILDPLPSGLTFIEGSVIIDGESYPDLTPEADMPIVDKTIASGESMVISYTAKVDSDVSSKILGNTAQVSYMVNNANAFTEKTNTVYTTIVVNVITITKTADVEMAVAGQTIVYTNVITNEGDLYNRSVVFRDEIPAETSFIKKSVVIDGTSDTSADPTSGIDIGDLAVGDKKTITFKVIVNVT